MRTVIFVGLASIADSINPNYQTSQDVIAMGAFILVVAIAMDCVEFMKNLLN